MVYQLPSPADFSWARFATFFLHAFSPNTTAKLRLYTDRAIIMRGPSP
jgi:hypothetical protein